MWNIFPSRLINKFDPIHGFIVKCMHMIVIGMLVCLISKRALPCNIYICIYIYIYIYIWKKNCFFEYPLHYTNPVVYRSPVHSSSHLIQPNRWINCKATCIDVMVKLYIIHMVFVSCTTIMLYKNCSIYIWLTTALYCL